MALAPATGKNLYGGPAVAMAVWCSRSAFWWRVREGGVE